MDLSKPRSNIEVPKSPSVAQTSELRSSADPAENKGERPSEKDAISSEKTCDEGKLSLVPIKYEQTRNVTPNASVEASETSNEDKQDLSVGMEQQESTTTSSEGDSSQTENGVPKNSAKRLAKSLTGYKQGNSVKGALQGNSTDISRENAGQTSSKTTKEQDRPEKITSKKPGAVQILEQSKTVEKQVTPVKDEVQQISAEVSSKDGDAGQHLSETTEKQAPPGNGTSKSADTVKQMLTRDKQDPKGAPKEINYIIKISLQSGAKPGVNNVKTESTDAQKASSQRDEGQSGEIEKETGSSSQSSQVKVPEKTSQQVVTDSSAGKVQIAVNNKNLKTVDLSQIQTVTAASGQKYSMIQKTSAMGSPIYESVDTKERYYWVPQSSLPLATLSHISEGLRLGKHYALVALKKAKVFKTY